MGLPEQIDEHLRGHGLSQRDLAERLGFKHASRLNMMLRGTRGIDDETAVAIAEALGWDPKATLLQAAIDRLPEQTRKRVAEPPPLARGPHATMRELELLWVQFEVERALVSESVDWTGNAYLTREYKGIRPRPGETIHEVVFREAAQKPRHQRAPDPPRHAVTEVPPGVEWNLQTKSDGPWRLFRFVLPAGWTRDREATREQCGSLGLSITSILEGAYDVAAIGHGALHHRVTHRVDELVLRFQFPSDYEPDRWYPPVAWRDAAPADEYRRNLIDAGCCLSHRLSPAGSSAELVIAEPLVSFSFAIEWDCLTPPTPRKDTQ